MIYKDDDEFEGVTSTDELVAGSKLQAERKKLQQQIKEKNMQGAKQNLSQLKMNANLAQLKNQIAGKQDEEQKRDTAIKDEQVVDTFGTKTLLETEKKGQMHPGDTLDAEDYIQQQQEHEEQKAESIEESSQVD